MMRVLVAVPVYRLWARAHLSVMALEWEGPLDVVYLRGGDVVPGDGNNPNELILAKYRRARALALQGEYDALLTIEDDMIVPPDALVELAAVDAAIVYGLYCFRHNSGAWSAFTRLDEHGGKSISGAPDKARAEFGNVIAVDGVGNGCTLIRRSVLERFDFRLGPHASPDWWLATDAKRYGFSQAAHLGVVCGHIDEQNGHTMALWPDPDAPDLCRRELLGAYC